jgi:hypothetical protein
MSITCNRPAMPAPKFETFSVSKIFVHVDTKGTFYMQRAGTAAVAFRYRHARKTDRIIC